LRCILTPLVAIILPAAAYPLEIVQAARLVIDTNNIPKVDEQRGTTTSKRWRSSRKWSPKWIADLAWTVDLGQRFRGSTQRVMDTIQALRKKAKDVGNLKTRRNRSSMSRTSSCSKPM
jgi:hypothetical protein